MKRTSNFRAKAATACLAAVLGTTAFAVDPWSQQGANPERTGQSTYPGPVTGAIAWEKSLSGQSPGIAINSNGLIATGAIFNGAWWSEEVYTTVFGPAGQLQFRKKVTPYPWGFTQGVNADPAWSADGNLVLASTNGQLLKISPLGIVAWKIQYRTDMTNDNSPATLPDNTIRHLTLGVKGIQPDGTTFIQGEGAKLLAVNSANGEMATGASRATSSSYRDYAGIFYLNADGTLKWTKKIYRGGGSMPVFGPDGTVYIGIGGGSTHAYTPSGTLKWSQAIGGYNRTYALGKTGRLYMPNGVGIVAFDAQTGAIAWEKTGIGAAVGGLAIDSNDRIYMGNTSGQLHCLDSAGNLVWTRQVCDAFTTGPAIGTNSTLAIAGKKGFDHYLFSIR